MSQPSANIRFKAVFFDLDGTIYRGSEPVPGLCSFVESLRDEQVKTAFITNSANATPEIVCRRLSTLNIPSSEQQVITASQAAARFVSELHGASGARVFTVAGPGLRSAMESEGHMFSECDVEYVVAGLDLKFTYEKLDKASCFIRSGAQFIGTNPDLIYNREDGIHPGGGVIVRAIELASGITPTIVGKPQPTMIKLALKEVGCTADQALFIVDNLETDIPCGARAGVRTALITTGVSKREDLQNFQYQPDWVVDSYEELRKLLVSERLLGSR